MSSKPPFPFNLVASSRGKHSRHRECRECGRNLCKENDECPDCGGPAVDYDW